MQQKLFKLQKLKAAVHDEQRKSVVHNPNFSINLASHLWKNNISSHQNIDVSTLFDVVKVGKLEKYSLFYALNFVKTLQTFHRKTYRGCACVII